MSPDLTVDYYTLDDAVGDESFLQLKPGPELVNDLMKRGAFASERASVEVKS